LIIVNEKFVINFVSFVTILVSKDSQNVDIPARLCCQRFTFWPEEGNNNLFYRI